jgi:hypothetical protein
VCRRPILQARTAFDKLRAILKKQDILIMWGWSLGVGNDLFDNADSFKKELFVQEKKNTFDKYDQQKR